MTENDGKKYARVVFEEEIPQNATDEKIVEIMRNAISGFESTDILDINDIEIHNRPYIQDECNNDVIEETYKEVKITEVTINEWPESQICIRCKHATFVPEGHGSSAYACEKNCEALSKCCKKNRVEVTTEEWHKKFE